MAAAGPVIALSQVLLIMLARYDRKARTGTLYYSSYRTSTRGNALTGRWRYAAKK